MGRHLLDKDIEAIVALVDGWKGRLTWNSLSEACLPLIGSTPTRQTLSKFSPIAHAYQAYQAALAGIALPAPAKRSPTTDAALQRLRRVEQQVRRLEQENLRLIEQFVVWQYNAYAHGMTAADLNRELPQVADAPKPSHESRRPIPAEIRVH